MRLFCACAPDWHPWRLWPPRKSDAGGPTCRCAKRARLLSQCRLCSKSHDALKVCLACICAALTRALLPSHAAVSAITNSALSCSHPLICASPRKDHSQDLLFLTACIYIILPNTSAATYEPLLGELCRPEPHVRSCSRVTCVLLA